MEKSFEEKIISAAQMTWDVIGGDCLVDDYGKIDYSKTMPRDHVIEIVSDAHHMVTNGDLSREDMKKFYSLDDKKKRKIMLKAFQFKTYGW